MSVCLSVFSRFFSSAFCLASSIDSELIPISTSADSPSNLCTSSKYLGSLRYLSAKAFLSASVGRASSWALRPASRAAWAKILSLRTFFSVLVNLSYPTSSSFLACSSPFFALLYLPSSSVVLSFLPVAASYSTPICSIFCFISPSLTAGRRINYIACLQLPCSRSSLIFFAISAEDPAVGVGGIASLTMAWGATSWIVGLGIFTSFQNFIIGLFCHFQGFLYFIFFDQFFCFFYCCTLFLFMSLPELNCQKTIKDWPLSGQFCKKVHNLPARLCFINIVKHIFSYFSRVILRNYALRKRISNDSCYSFANFIFISLIGSHN